MNQAFWTDDRVAGAVLVASLLLQLLSLVVLVTSGARTAFGAMVRGSLAEVAPYAGTFRLLILLFAVGWIVQLLGLGLLTRLLAQAGRGQLATLACSLVFVAVILSVLYSTFRMSVELWAAQEAARTGAIPALFAPLEAWTSSFFRLAYQAHFIAIAGFGWAILRARLLPPWLGWAAIGWSVFWFVAALAGVGAPAIPFLMPAAIGVALLWP